MPKKYQQKSLLTKPASSAPSSLSLSRTERLNENGAVAERTVNDLIRESRRAQNPSNILPNYHATTSIPPALRAVLDVPTPPPPAPRSTGRGTARLRRVPGPPPPRSWLHDSKYADGSRSEPSIHDSRMQWITQSCSLPGATFPSVRSLQHLLLKQIATDWTWHIDYDHEFLAELPVTMREILLSYIAIYSEGVGPNPVRILFPQDNLDECKQVVRLDMGNAVGGWASVRAISKELFIGHQSRLQSSPSSVKRAEHTVLPDAWQDETDEEIVPSISHLSPNASRFQNLKHLSLAAAPNASQSLASWHELLGLLSKIPTIVSLSLAYWPQPTFTPNASRGRYKIRTANPGSSPDVTYGGSDFYTAFDVDWREAAGILRTLSRTTYCLKWLDLTGCGEWLPALVWTPEEDEIPIGFGPDWNGAWRDLQHLTLAIGWNPGSEPVALSNQTHALASQLDQMNLTSSSSSSSLHVPESETWDIAYERAKQYYRVETARYAKVLGRTQQVIQTIRATRKAHGGKWIDVDMGQVEAPPAEMQHNDRCR